MTETKKAKILAANVFIDPCLNVDNINNENGGKSEEKSHFYLIMGKQILVGKPNTTLTNENDKAKLSF